MCFNIDANGILTVTAEDKVTKVVNRVVIENSKGRLNEDEIEQMVADAERFAAEVGPCVACSASPANLRLVLVLCSDCQ